MENIALEEKQDQIIQETPKENKRLVGLDLLKILSMFFILIHHFSKHGGFYENATGFTQTFLLILNDLFLPSVNVFVFISAYLIVKKNKFSLKKLLYLFLEIIFFALLTYFLFLIISKEQFNIKTFFACLNPIENYFWFTNAYVFMYLLSPVLLMIINKLNKNGYLILLLTLFIITLFSTYTPFFPILNNGFTWMWFVFLFFFAGYQAKFEINLKKWIWLIIYIIAISLSFFVFGGEVVKHPIYTSAIAILETISLFNLFKDINIKNNKFAKIIMVIQSCTLGIYLLHDSIFTRNILYSKIFCTQNFYLKPTSLLWFILFVFITFIVCLLFDLGKKYICKLFLKIFDKIKNKRKQKTSCNQKDTD